MDHTSPSTIAGLTDLTLGAVSKLIDRLLSKNLVTHKEPANDRRYQDIRLYENILISKPEDPGTNYSQHRDLGVRN